MMRRALCAAAVVVAVFVARPGIASHEGEQVFEVKTDTKSIEKGRALFKEKCVYCHDPSSVKQLDGPGLKGILKNPTLPYSGRPATPENVVNQLRHPYKGMPLFIFSQEELASLLSYLNTL